MAGRRTQAVAASVAVALAGAVLGALGGRAVEAATGLEPPRRLYSRTVGPVRVDAQLDPHADGPCAGQGVPTFTALVTEEAWGTIRLTAGSAQHVHGVNDLRVTAPAALFDRTVWLVRAEPTVATVRLVVGDRVVDSTSPSEGWATLVGPHREPAAPSPDAVVAGVDSAGRVVTSVGVAATAPPGTPRTCVGAPA